MNQPVGVITAKNQSTSERTVIQLTYAPVIHTSGGDSQSIQAQLEEHDTELLEKIETLMDEREAAQARRAY
jgi:cyanophycinase-like exopeptidase